MNTNITTTKTQQSTNTWMRVGKVALGLTFAVAAIAAVGSSLALASSPIHGMHVGNWNFQSLSDFELLGIASAGYMACGAIVALVAYGALHKRHEDYKKAFTQHVIAEVAQKATDKAADAVQQKIKWTQANIEMLNENSSLRLQLEIATKEAEALRQKLAALEKKD